jgi:rhomboid protease GluP
MNSITERMKIYFQRYPATATLLLINTVMVFVTLLMGGFSVDNLITLGAMKPILITQDHEYYRLIMPMFLHGSVIHFLANSYFLFYMGQFVERLLGIKKYILIYLLSGLGSSLLIWWLGQPNGTTIGASGALFGILGAVLVLTYIKSSWFTPMGIKNIRTLVVINLIFTFLFPNISIYGHLGGFISGMILIYFLTPNKPSIRSFFNKKDDKNHPETIIIDYDDIEDDDIYYH